MLKRTTCRKHYKALRNEMPREAVAAKSTAICEKVLKSTAYKTSQVILAYYPLGNEVNCLPVLEDALNKGKQVMLPRTEADCEMNFYEIHSFLDVEEGHFHVMEPKAYCDKFEADSCNAEVLVLVPGVAFDYEGNRYGYGKGYYDRYFSRFPQLKRIALAYTDQLSENSLECLETDVKMHAIVTEQGVHLINEMFEI